MDNDLEVRQLQETIVALREELERARLSEREQVRQGLVAADEEILQLRVGILEVREQLDIREAQFQDKLRELEARHERERTELQQTIATLRKRLEEQHEALKNTGSPAEAAGGRPPR